MKIVVIGGTGLIGSQVVTNLRSRGHQVIAASPANGINTITGEGLAEAMTNTDVVIDLANSPSFEEKAVLEFFQTAGRNLLAAETNAGVQHHVALSIVGVDRMSNLAYMKAKIAQETLIKESGVPYTIVRSTQFIEFMASLANAATNGNEVHISDVQFQPIASADVAAFVAQIAIDTPVNGIVQIAGPERSTMDKLIAKYLKDMNDPRQVIVNSNSFYFTDKIPNDALVPAGEAKLGSVTIDAWLSKQLQKA